MLCLLEMQNVAAIVEFKSTSGKWHISMIKNHFSKQCKKHHSNFKVRFRSNIESAMITEDSRWAGNA